MAGMLKELFAEGGRREPTPSMAASPRPLRIGLWKEH